MVLITITTVGYGEVIPISSIEGGLILTMIVMVTGLGVSFYFLSALTAFIIEGDLREVIWRRRMSQTIQSLRNHYIVCGAGEVGHNVIVELLRARKRVICVEISHEKLDALHRRLETPILCIQGDATEDEVLLACGIDRAAGIIAALQEDRDNLFVAVTARQLKDDLRIIARASNDGAATKMKRAGADAVVCPNTIGGLRMASVLLRPTVVGLMDLIVRDSAQSLLSVEEFNIPEASPLNGSSLSHSGIRQVSNSLVLLVVTESGPVFNPSPQLTLEAGMTIVALGELDELDCLERYIQGEAVLARSPRGQDLDE